MWQGVWMKCTMEKYHARRLSWLINGDGANHKQTQYQIITVFELCMFYTSDKPRNGIFS